MDFSLGSVHDFRLLKESGHLSEIPKSTVIHADRGYSGLENVFENSYVPYKKRRNVELTEFQKEVNRHLSSIRIKIEHIIGRLKRFRILSERYRGRRSGLSLYFRIIASIHNLEIQLNM
jgi:IS5 family transposase